MYLAYQVLVIVLLIITGPYILLRGIFGGHGIKERLGFWKFIRDDRQTIWFHAASMGELKAINSILPELLKITPEVRVIITTITKTGKTEALRLFKPVEVFYLPIDLSCCISRAIRKVKPSLLILVETELWPVMISRSHQAGVKMAVINARLSLKSFKFYKLFRSFFASIVGKIDFIMAQTDDHANRFMALGADKERVSVYGNIKVDQVLNQNPKPPAPELLDFLNHDDKFIFIAGSIWPGEFDVVITAIRKLPGSRSHARIILAPRHLSNLSKLEEALRLSNVGFVKRSRLLEDKTEGNVMILDSMGELGGLYRYANLAFVGGSLVKIGGHDPLEPASSACPVCFGPHMENSKSFVEILIKAGGAFYISDAGSLASLMMELADNPEKAKTIGQKAYRAVLSHAGVSRNIARKLAEFL